MKNVMYAGCLLAFLLMGASCADSSKKEKEGQNEKHPQLVGNSKDEHGCLTSAGYQWSEAKKDCIRIWEVGTRLISGDKHLFVVFSPDSAQVEIFLGKEKSLLLQKQEGVSCWVMPETEEKVTLNNSKLTVVVDGVEYR